MLIFDGDCGFCSTGARLAERLLPGDVRTVPWQRVPDLAAYGLTAEEAAASLQWVGSSGSLAGGHEAVAQLLIDAGGGLWGLLGRALLLPLVRDLAKAVYEVVARNRNRLPGGTPACRVPLPKADEGAAGR